ncbi:MAG: FtsQ-type POTRA domain-containing protein [Clostridiales bacterium]|nr:FtsQ-type POTRA domain-containing protein [Clostridiales bacterium]
MKEIRFSFDEDENLNNDSEFENPEVSDDDIHEILFEFDKNRKAEDTYYNEDEYDEDEEFDDDDFDDEGFEPIEDEKQRGDRKRTKKQRSKFRLKNVILTLLVIAGAVVILLASPVFSVNNIEINELNYFTTDEICSMIGLSVGDNGVFFNKTKAEKTLANDKYISSAEITFKMPDTMIITVDENKIYGYISYLNSYLYIDKDGRVIDIKTETEENLPIIEGLKFSTFTQGEIIPVENEDAFSAALIISRAMSKYDVLDKDVTINVADEDNIYAYVDNIKVLLGDTTRMEEKIKTMAEAILEIPDGDRGTLDLQDLDKTIIFKYST